MATSALDQAPPAETTPGHRFDQPSHPFAKILFFVILLGALAFAGWSVLNDTAGAGEHLELGVFAFLGVALLIALGFEFVNGFHDTANAVATVIYTNSMPAQLAVVWSGFFNFLGVMLSSGAVAYTIVTLLPVDLILNVGSASGFAMIFALLFAAVIWNLATWYVGLPNSSSHTLIGSVLGVGLANQLILQGSRGGTAGVDWGQVQKVLTGLWMAPLIGFGAALVLMFAMRFFSTKPKLQLVLGLLATLLIGGRGIWVLAGLIFMGGTAELNTELVWVMGLLIALVIAFCGAGMFKTPEGDAPPPTGIRGLMILTCTAISFSHGSNDGQKGMGLIMLILIGCAPTAYALNRTQPASETPAFVQSANAATAVFDARSGQVNLPVDQARGLLTTALQQHKIDTPTTYAALESLSRDLGARVGSYGSLKAIPADATHNVRNDMYLVLDSTRLITKKPPADFSASDITAIKAYQTKLEAGTRFIPLWVKIVVAIALGLGTMIGWKRIVITVGEKIGKHKLTYAQGAASGLVTASTILGADGFGLPVSTTHILSSSVAGGSVASGGGLQARTIGNLAAAWVMTLPVAMLLSGGLYWIMLNVVKLAGWG